MVVVIMEGAHPRKKGEQIDMSTRKFMWETITMLAMVSVFTLSTGAEGAKYEFGDDSTRQEGVPEGTVTKHTWDGSKVYPDTEHEYWVYVPAQYTETEPACVMVFQDGQSYVSEEGPVRASIVFDNLIHKGEMPVTIGIFINPGKKGTAYDQREFQYVTISDTYARFLLEEMIPLVGKDYNLVEDASGRAVCGMSDGGVCAFTIAWERPDAFSKVISHIGSYVRLGQGSEYPLRIRETRGNPKPIRVFLQDGENDMNSTLGSWALANVNMDAALKFARYDSRLEMGTGWHDLNHGGAIFPDTLRWIWRDYPGVKGADDPPDHDAVIGEWEVVTTYWQNVMKSSLTIGEKDGALVAKLVNDKGEELNVSKVSLEDNFLTYEYGTTPPKSKGKDPKAEGAKDEDVKEWVDPAGMRVWVKVNGNSFEGALASMEKSDFELDYPVIGRRKGTASDAE